MTANRRMLRSCSLLSLLAGLEVRVGKSMSAKYVSRRTVPLLTSGWISRSNNVRAAATGPSSKARFQLKAAFCTLLHFAALASPAALMDPVDTSIALRLEAS